MKKEISAVFCCEKENDLISALEQSGFSPVHTADAQKALELAADGTAVFLLADKYPDAGTNLTAAFLEQARAKNLRIYVEFPQALPGQETEAAAAMSYERLVVNTPFGGLNTGDIMMQNGCTYRTIATTQPAIVSIARVAGYDKAIFGLPENTTPLLVYLDEKQDVLVASSCLSGFITSRHAPTTAWKKLWEGILSAMGCGEISLQWEKTVNVTASPDAPLAADSAKQAYLRNVAWMKDHTVTYGEKGIAILEGFNSAIDHDGKQGIQKSIRGDCMSEVAMGLCCGWKQTQDPELLKIVYEIVDRLFDDPDFYHNDPNSGMYGLMNWFEKGETFYGDDNARVLLGLLCVREMTGESRWDEHIFRCAASNLRTSSTSGLRRPCLSAASFGRNHWSHYFDEEYLMISPHYQSYLLAAFLWIYALTGIEEFLIRGRRGIAVTMENFPDGLNWQNSLSGEVTRMLLPLCFLQRVDPCEKHLQWLRQVVDATLEYQVECGAIRDGFGSLEMGKYPPPQSNEAYGTSEASLIQENGDPATDLLYTANWALIGLWEASLLLPDTYIKTGYEKLRDFLLRIQLVSKEHPWLDGSWMRSFDYDKWEYWGSSADIGWAAMSIESGWTNAWITAILVLEERGESLMQLSSKEAFSKIAPAIYEDMMTRRETNDAADVVVAKMEGSAE